MYHTAWNTATSYSTGIKRRAAARCEYAPDTAAFEISYFFVSDELSNDKLRDRKVVGCFELELSDGGRIRDSETLNSSSVTQFQFKAAHYRSERSLDTRRGWGYTCPGL